MCFRRHKSSQMQNTLQSDVTTVGIPLERGLLEGSILAYDMNLAPLTSEDGYSVRAIVTGLYGMMNPKWITR
jgi:DMSO/TMAO reductase YedYZ molybdopterin-dependent catalytic subunit